MNVIKDLLNFVAVVLLTPLATSTIITYFILIIQGGVEEKKACTTSSHVPSNMLV